MSAYMHHEEYNPELGPPTKQNLIELIDKYSDRPFIPVFHLDHEGTFTRLSVFTAASTGRPIIEDGGNPMLRYRYYVGCRDCYQVLTNRLTDQPFGNLIHDHNLEQP